MLQVGPRHLNLLGAITKSLGSDGELLHVDASHDNSRGTTQTRVKNEAEKCSNVEASAMGSFVEVGQNIRFGLKR